MQLKLPTIQNWSCHNCAGCCRQHLIEVTEEERQRIIQQNWTAADGIESGRPVLVPFGPPWKRRYRLGHQTDGACIFLDERGLCRIHAKFGEAAKPLPCRIYPYAFHPAGKQLAVSLRFSCPSVVANRGKNVAEQSRDLKDYASRVAPKGFASIEPPAISARERVDWPDFLRFVAALENLLVNHKSPLTTRLQQTLFWLGLIEQAKFDRVRGERLDELLSLLEEAAANQFENPVEPSEPSRIGLVQFRLLVAQHARKDTFLQLETGWRGRWSMLTSAFRFSRGTGTIPSLQPELKEVPFEHVEAASFGPLPPETDEMLTRYFRVKIEGLHFCGRGFYDWPLVEGARSLVLFYPVVLWIARWHAASAGRTTLQTEDIAQAIAIADHPRGYSPLLGSSNVRRRIRLLNQSGELEKLCVWYTR